MAHFSAEYFVNIPLSEKTSSARSTCTFKATQCVRFNSKAINEIKLSKQSPVQLNSLQTIVELWGFNYIEFNMHVRRELKVSTPVQTNGNNIYNYINHYNLHDENFLQRTISNRILQTTWKSYIINVYVMWCTYIQPSLD